MPDEADVFLGHRPGIGHSRLEDEGGAPPPLSGRGVLAHGLVGQEFF
ncbi:MULTISPECIES: hypothetical protein [unclassified Corynebacterium]|nr:MULTISPECIES: hypothetical protein [unclassified Corynebacterium]WPF67005.1 hypothetical protein OLX12_04605 [Corynebacterium sp. 22KM0430]WPF69493.1 hypothetical protein OLW90_04600 [Corynebacterium sp. 21KM1197]